MSKALSPEQARRIQADLETLVRTLRIIPRKENATEKWTGKLREEDWIPIYCAAHDAPVSKFSNKFMRDYCFNGKGVEFKVKGVPSPLDYQGRRPSHVITRVVEWSELDSEEQSKTSVLKQLADHEDKLYAQATASLINSSEVKPVANYGILLYSQL